MKSHQHKVLCRNCNSVRQFSNIAISAAVNISWVVFCINCHSGSLKRVTAEGWGEAEVIKDQFATAAGDSRQSNRRAALYSVQRYWCTLVLRN